MASFNEALKASLEYFNGDEIAAQKFISKYALHDANGDVLELTPADLHRRLAREFARIEAKYPNPMSEDEIFTLLDKFADVVAQGSPMSGVGNYKQIQSLSNCFVIASPFDSYGGILRTDQEQVQIMKRRGGVGFDISTIRPRGLLTANAARTTDGIEVFMERFSNSCREVAQGGRRGALMLTISCHHPQIRDFINVKRDLKKVTGANISIRLSDEFMRCVRDGQPVQLRFPVEPDVPHLIEEMVDARKLWDDMIEAAHNSAEPGLLFWDNIITKSPADIYAQEGFETTSTNPCLTGEMRVAVADGRGLVPIKQLADDGLDVPVYACDDEGRVIVKTMRNPRVTGRKVPVFKVTIEGGQTFRATSNHKMRMVDGTYRELKDLRSGDQLHIAYRRPGSLVELTNGSIDDHEKKYVILENAKTKKSEHRLIWEFHNGNVPKGHVIHHFDFNSFNNSIENLTCMSADDHRELHAIRMRGNNNPMRRAKTEWSIEKWRRYHDNMSSSVSGLKNGRAYSDITDSDIQHHALELTKQLGRRFSKSEWVRHCSRNDIPVGSMFRAKTLGTSRSLGMWAVAKLGIEYADVDPRTQRRYAQARSQGYEARIVSSTTSHASRVLEVKKVCEECNSAFWQDYDKREVGFCSLSCANKHNNRVTDVNVRRTSTINLTYAKKAEETKKKILDAYTEVRFRLGRDPLQKEVQDECKQRGITYRLKTKHGFCSWDEIKEIARVHNHRVVSIEPDGFEDVYNGTVDGVHDFYFAPNGDDNLLLNNKNCGELPLCPNDSCRLMVVNLASFVENPYRPTAKFMWDRFNAVVQKAQRLMDDLIDLEIECVERIINKIDSDPEPDHVKVIEKDLWTKILKKAMTGRRTGLGITALGDMLAMLNVRYGSDESIVITENVYKQLALSTYKSSAIMARERGKFPIHDYDREKNHPFLRQLFDADAELESLVRLYGRRNIACNTTAPAGTVSLMTQTTSGIEPVFLLSYVRRAKISASDRNAKVDFIDELGDKWQEFEVFHPGFKRWMDVTGKGPKDVAESPYWKATSADIDWEAKVRVQAAAQKWIDHSISNTTNIPENTPVEVTKRIYMTGWETGCKGVTIYRANSRAGVLVEKKQDDSFKQHQAPKRPKELPCQIHHANIKNETWTILVGLLDGKPYEIFGGLSRYVEIPKKYDEGVLIKNERKTTNSTYDLKIGNGSGFVIRNVVEQFDNPNYSVMTRMISLALRHGASAQYVAEQLQKGDRDSDMFSFAKVISRVLKSYIKDGANTTMVKLCQQCSSSNFAYQEGCPICLNCGWSKCA